MDANEPFNSHPMGHFTPSQHPSIHHDDEFPPSEQEQQAMSYADDNYQSHYDMQQEQQAIASGDANSKSQLSPEAYKVEVTPTSTPCKVRRGCTCQTVLCERISCKCFKDGVGCSDHCRCEKCKNCLGTREEYDQAILRSTNDINERLGIGIAQSNSLSTQPMELNTHVPSHIPPFQSSMENVTPSSHISASHHLMPNLVPGTRKRRNMPDANSLYHSGENMRHLQHPGVVPFGSAQSHGRYPQRLQIDMIQAGPVQSASRDPQHMRLDSILADFMQSAARDPQCMQSTLNRPHEPMSDHMNMSRPTAKSVSQFGENLGQLHHAGVGHSGSAQRHGRYPQRLQIDMIQAGPVQSAASRDPRHMQLDSILAGLMQSAASRNPRHMQLDSILAGLRQSAARDPQRLQSTLNRPHEPLSDHRDEYMNTSRPHANPVSQSVENMDHLHHPGVGHFGSVQPHGRYSPRPRMDLVQDGLVLSNARDPQRMQSTLNLMPHEPLSDHRDMYTNTPPPRANSVSQFGENMGHLHHPGVGQFGSAQPQGRYPPGTWMELVQEAASVPSDARDPQRMQSTLNLMPHEPFSDHMDMYTNTPPPRANSVSQFGENMDHLHHPGVGQFGSAQPQGRYPPRTWMELVQEAASVPSDARDPQRMELTLNLMPHEPLSDHKDLDMNTSRPNANSVSQFGENMDHLHHPGVGQFGSAQPQGRYPPRTWMELVQEAASVPSDAIDPQRMELTLNLMPHEPLSDHKDLDMNTSRPNANSVSQFGENMGHLQHHGRCPPRPWMDSVQAGSVPSDARDPQHIQMDLIQVDSVQSNARDPQHMRPTLNLMPLEPLSDHRDKNMHIPRPGSPGNGFHQ